MFGLLKGYLLTKLNSKRLHEANFSLVLKLKHLHKLQLSALSLKSLPQMLLLAVYSAYCY